jgi:hypothetical protein
MQKKQPRIIPKESRALISKNLGESVSLDSVKYAEETSKVQPKKLTFADIGLMHHRDLDDKDGAFDPSSLIATIRGPPNSNGFQNKNADDAFLNRLFHNNSESRGSAVHTSEQNGILNQITLDEYNPITGTRIDRANQALQKGHSSRDSTVSKSMPAFRSHQQK